MEKPTWGQLAPDHLHTEPEERLRFETLLTEISARFVSLAASQVDSEIEDAQRAICGCLDLDHSALWQVSREDGDHFNLTHLYRAPELPPPLEHMTGSEFFPWEQRKLQAKEIVDVPNTAELPPRWQELCFAIMRVKKRQGATEKSWSTESEYGPRERLKFLRTVSYQGTASAVATPRGKGRGLQRLCEKSVRAKRLSQKSLILSLRSGRAEPFRTAGGAAAGKGSFHTDSSAPGGLSG
jgi:hypothetical protein